MKNTTLAATAAPARPQGSAPTPNAPATPRNGLALVPYRSSKNAFMRVGGNLPKVLEKKGFNMNLRQLENFPSKCPAKTRLEVVPLQLPSGATALTTGQLEAELEKRHLAYASGCEFLDWVSAQPGDLSKSVTFLTKPRRNGKNGKPVWLIASEKDVYAVTAGKDFHPEMVVLCVSTAHAANRK